MTRLLVLDTETGGIDSATQSVLSVGLVVWDDGQLVAQTEVLVAENPVVTTPEAMAVNRIDLERHKAQALPPAVAVERIEQFVAAHFGDAFEAGEKVVLAGHNIGFDIGFLKRLYRLTEMPFERRFSHRSVDTASIMRFLQLCGLAPAEALTSDGAFAFFGIEPALGDRHTALGDARATAELLQRLVGLVRERNLGGGPHASGDPSNGGD